MLNFPPGTIFGPIFLVGGSPHRVCDTEVS